MIYYFRDKLCSINDKSFLYCPVSLIRGFSLSTSKVSLSLCYKRLFYVIVM
nr:MAG TPA: hypothetical protein [Caudoviricetes sp.]